MKKNVLAALLFTGVFISAAAQDNRASFALNHYAARDFIAGAVGEADLNTVIQAGIRAPSARNGQPWHFTVIRNQALARRIIPNLVDGNVLVVVSAKGDGKTNGAGILDCALAVESMYLAAQAIGLGSRIYTGPMDAINRGMKADLSLPSGFSAVALLRICRFQAGVDAVSAASSRRSAQDVVTYK